MSKYSLPQLLLLQLPGRGHSQPDVVHLVELLLNVGNGQVLMVFLLKFFQASRIENHIWDWASFVVFCFFAAGPSSEVCFGSLVLSVGFLHTLPSGLSVSALSGLSVSAGLPSGLSVSAGFPSGLSVSGGLPSGSFVSAGLPLASSSFLSSSVVAAFFALPFPFAFACALPQIRYMMKSLCSNVSANNQSRF